MPGSTDALDTRQIATLSALGAAIWLGAALLLRGIGPLDGGMRALFYAALVPGTLPFIWLAKKAGRLARDQIVAGVALISGVAALLDGVALIVAPTLYGMDTAGAAAALLWGVGVGLMLALVLSRRTPS